METLLASTEKWGPYLAAVNLMSKRVDDFGATATPKFPSRPGKECCHSYAAIGECRFGTTCKYDHPLVRGVDSQPTNPRDSPVENQLHIIFRFLAIINNSSSFVMQFMVASMESCIDCVEMLPQSHPSSEYGSIHELMFDALPRLANKALFYKSHDTTSLSLILSRIEGIVKCWCFAEDEVCSTILLNERFNVKQDETCRILLNSVDACILTNATEEDALEETKTETNALICETLAQKLCDLWPDREVSLTPFGTANNNVGSAATDLEISLFLIGMKSPNESSTVRAIEYSKLKRSRPNRHELKKYPSNQSQTPMSQIHNMNPMSVGEILMRIGDVGKRCGFTVVASMPNARVPVTKIIHISSTTRVDISVGNRLGLLNADLLRTYEAMDARVPPLLAAVRLWAQRRGVSDPDNSALSPFAWSLLVIYFLQAGCAPPVLPNVQQSKSVSSEATDSTGSVATTDDWSSENKATVGELLARFFVFYGTGCSCAFNVFRNVASVRGTDGTEATTYDAPHKDLWPLGKRGHKSRFSKACAKQQGRSQDPFKALMSSPTIDSTSPSFPVLELQAKVAALSSMSALPWGAVPQQVKKPPNRFGAEAKDAFLDNFSLPPRHGHGHAQGSSVLDHPFYNSSSGAQSLTSGTIGPRSSDLGVGTAQPIGGGLGIDGLSISPLSPWESNFNPLTSQWASYDDEKKGSGGDQVASDHDMYGPKFSQAVAKKSSLPNVDVPFGAQGGSDVPISKPSTVTTSAAASTSTVMRGACPVAEAGLTSWRFCIEDPFEDKDVGQHVRSRAGHLHIMAELRRAVVIFYNNFSSSLVVGNPPALVGGARASGAVQAEAESEYKIFGFDKPGITWTGADGETSATLVSGVTSSPSVSSISDKEEKASDVDPSLGTISVSASAPASQARALWEELMERNSNLPYIPHSCSRCGAAGHGEDECSEGHPPPHPSAFSSTLHAAGENTAIPHHIPVHHPSWPSPVHPAHPTHSLVDRVSDHTQQLPSQPQWGTAHNFPTANKAGVGSGVLARGPHAESYGVYDQAGGVFIPSGTWAMNEAGGRGGRGPSYEEAHGYGRTVDHSHPKGRLYASDGYRDELSMSAMWKPPELSLERVIQTLYDYLQTRPRCTMDGSSLADFYAEHPNCKTPIQKIGLAGLCSVPEALGLVVWEKDNKAPGKGRIRALAPSGYMEVNPSGHFAPSYYAPLPPSLQPYHVHQQPPMSPYQYAHTSQPTAQPPPFHHSEGLFASRPRKGSVTWQTSMMNANVQQLWVHELDVLRDLGYGDPEAIIPILEENIRVPTSLIPELMGVPPVDGMRKVVHVLHRIRRSHSVNSSN